MRNFRWPEFDRFNWALEWFDVIARDNHRPALLINVFAPWIAEATVFRLS